MASISQEKTNLAALILQTTADLTVATTANTAAATATQAALTSFNSIARRRLQETPADSEDFRFDEMTGADINS